MNRVFTVLIALVTLTGCNSILVNKEFQKTTAHGMYLGTVGESTDFVLEKDYNHITFPEYQTPIKVQVTKLDFNKTSYKAFVEAQLNQAQKVSVNYIDSLKQKPKYIKLDIADRLAVLNTLNDNKDLFNFLKNKNEAHLVTSIAMALNNADINAVSGAEEVFLEITGIKEYNLNLYNNKELQQTINFKDGVVFAYKTSSCCWKQNDRYKLEIIDLAEGDNKCPKKSYKSAHSAKKNINYFKL